MFNYGVTHAMLYVAHTIVGNLGLSPFKNIEKSILQK